MDRLKIFDGNFQVEFPSRGKHSIVLLYKGEKVFTYGRIFCGKFSEVGALEKKFRIHPNQDNLSAEIESTNVIPFGCEYEISRDINAASHLLRITEDIRAVNFGRVGDIALEEVRFPANIASLEYLVYGENTMRKVTDVSAASEIFCGNEPVVMATVLLKNNVKVDFGCGSDVWRLRSASNMEGVSAEFSLAVDEDELVLRRKPLIYAEGVEIEQRPWRFKSIVSWQACEEEQEIVSGAEEFSNAPCMLAPTARREFRRKVRRSKENLICTESVPALCNDASHLEKPEKRELCHFDLEEYMTSYVWANRQLGRQDKKFAFSFKENMFSNTAAVSNLSKSINVLEFEDDEMEE